MSHPKTVLVIVTLVCVLASAIASLIVSGTASNPVDSIDSMPMTEQAAPIEDEPVTPTHPTPGSESVSDSVQIDLTKNALLYNSVPILSLSEDELFNRRWYTVPGASFDGLRGLTLPDAFQFISNTFPQLTVRAVPIGEPISLEYRRDRVTVQYDSYNKRVISARIG